MHYYLVFVSIGSEPTWSQMDVFLPPIALTLVTTWNLSTLVITSRHNCQHQRFDISTSDAFTEYPRKSKTKNPFATEGLKHNSFISGCPHQFCSNH